MIIYCIDIVLRLNDPETAWIIILCSPGVTPVVPYARFTSMDVVPEAVRVATRLPSI